MNVVLRHPRENDPEQIFILEIDHFPMYRIQEHDVGAWCWEGQGGSGSEETRSAAMRAAVLHHKEKCA